VTCYRLYERDIPDFPLILDWYDGEAVVWLYSRKKDETAAMAESWKKLVNEQIMEGLDLTPRHVYFKERKRQKGADQYDRLSERGAVRTIKEQGLHFEVNLSDYLDTGIFLDHRNTRSMIRDMSKGKRILNLFAYTGAFTCYACHGGADSSVSVEMSQTYCNWIGRNIRNNGFKTGKAHRIVKADCLDYIRRAIDRFDIIICDPPTFSNSKRMNTNSFAVERDHPDLINRSFDLLAPHGKLIFSSNSRRLKLREKELSTRIKTEEISNRTIPEDFRNKKIHKCWIMKRG